MLKKIIATSLMTSTLIFSGCGDSEGESRLETQNMLDNGEFIGVITKLEGNAATDEEFMALASAYMGKAGYSILEIASAMSKDTPEGEADDPMKRLVSDDKPASSVTDLSKAATYYKKVVGEDACDSQKNEENNITLDTNQEDVCLFISLSAIAKTATTLDLLAGDMASFSSSDEDANTTDYKLSASGCAMQYAFDNNFSVTETDDCTFSVANNDVNFTIVNRLYRPLDVKVIEDVNATIYHFMMTAEDEITHNRSTALTKEYCTNESFERFEEYNTTLYACPVNEDPEIEETTSVGVLTDTLNGDIDAILAIAPKSDDDEDTVGEDEITEFKCDVINGTYDDTTKACSLDNAEVDFATRDIQEEELINYMNTRDEE